jgi:hypothetical protein
MRRRHAHASHFGGARPYGAVVEYRLARARLWFHRVGRLRANQSTLVRHEFRHEEHRARKSTWQEREDLMIRAMVAKLGTQWDAIAAQVRAAGCQPAHVAPWESSEGFQPAPLHRKSWSSALDSAAFLFMPIATLVVAAARPLRGRCAHPMAPPQPHHSERHGGEHI